MAAPMVGPITERLNWAPLGYLIGAVTIIVLRSKGVAYKWVFAMHAKYFRLFTWKGYEDKDLTTVDDLHYLNVQGDNSNAALLIINPVLDIHLARQWSLKLSAAYYSRRTFYKYHDKVHAKTFETKVGITCRL